MSVRDFGGLALIVKECRWIFGTLGNQSTFPLTLLAAGAVLSLVDNTLSTIPASISFDEISILISSQLSNIGIVADVLLLFFLQMDLLSRSSEQLLLLSEQLFLYSEFSSRTFLSRHIEQVMLAPLATLASDDMDEELMRDSSTRISTGGTAGVGVTGELVLTCSSPS
jgi:hypothetical protein